MSDVATIGGLTQNAKAVVVVALNGSGFPIDPVSSVVSTDDTVLIGGLRKSVTPIALFTLDEHGDNPTPGAGGNATVPPDAPIQPPQAFVDNVTKFQPNFNLNTGNVVDISNQGITFIETADNGLVFKWAYSVGNSMGTPNLNASGNALTLAVVDALLASFVANIGTFGGSGPGILDLSGGTNAAPTQDTAVVSGSGTPEADGTYTDRGASGGKRFYTLVGQANNNSNFCIVWSGSARWEIWGATDLLYTSTDDTQFPWQATFVSGVGTGVDPAPTASSTNSSQAALITAGWTITTN